MHRKRGRQGLLENIRGGYFEEHKGIGGERNYHNDVDRFHPDCSKFIQLRSHLELFTTRELSNESDSINAFMGILREHAREEPVISHYLGLPTKHP